MLQHEANYFRKGFKIKVFRNLGEGRKTEIKTDDEMAGALATA